MLGISAISVFVSTPFSVLVGFLHGWAERRAQVARAIRRFNPFQGFGGVSAATLTLCHRPTLSGRFNSFQGFGGVSARSLFRQCSGSRLVSIPFRVLVGFLREYGYEFPDEPPCEGIVSIPFRVLVRFLLALCLPRARPPRLVSIPFRVLVGFLRCVVDPERLDRLVGFQSLSGFWWGFCWKQCPKRYWFEYVFQSLSGFGGVSALPHN